MMCEGLPLQQRQSRIPIGPHDLKELDYDDEEFNMNEQSEEGTAVDYDS